MDTLIISQGGMNRKHYDRRCLVFHRGDCLGLLLGGGDECASCQMVGFPEDAAGAFVSVTRDGAVVYERKKENIELPIPMGLTLYPMQKRGLELIVPAESRIGGVVVRYPPAFLFVTGI